MSTPSSPSSTVSNDRTAADGTATRRRSPASSASERRSTGTRPTGGGDAAASPASCNRRAFLAAGAGLAAAGVASASGVAAAQSAPSVDVSLVETEIAGGGTTELELTLSKVPENGLTGVTVEVVADGSVARFTEEARWEADWPQSLIDTADDPASAWVSMNNGTASGLGPIEAGATDVNLGFVEVVGVGSGETTIEASVQSLLSSDAEEVSATAGSATLTVTGDASESELSEHFGGSGGSGDGGTTGGDGGSGGSEGEDSSGASSDGGDDSDGTGDDGSGGDGQPGFGVGAALVALAAGVGARLRGGDGGDDGA